MVSATRTISECVYVCAKPNQSSVQRRISAFLNVWLRSLIRGCSVHTLTHVQCSIFCILTDVRTQFNFFFRSAVCCSHFCLLRLSKKDVSLRECVFFSFSNHFIVYLAHTHGRARSYTAQYFHQWSSYSLCLSAVLCCVCCVLCFYFVKLIRC